MEQGALDALKAQVARCRRLAKSIDDHQAIDALMKMAKDLEEQIKQIEARTGRP